MRTAPTADVDAAHGRASRAPEPGDRDARTVPVGLLLAGLAVTLLLALTAAVSWGSSGVPFTDVWATVLHRLTGGQPRPGPHGAPVLLFLLDRR